MRARVPVGISVDAQGRAQKLREVPLFSEIQDQKFLKRLAKELKPRSASAGTAIITVGEQDPNEMFFLRTGEVEVVVGRGAPPQTAAVA